MEEDKSLALTNLMEIVRERSGISIADCREVADRYSGDHWDEFVFWKISSGTNNRKTLTVLPNPFGNPKTGRTELSRYGLHLNKRRFFSFLGFRGFWVLEGPLWAKGQKKSER